MISVMISVSRPLSRVPLRCSGNFARNNLPAFTRPYSSANTQQGTFLFSSENFVDPKLKNVSKIIDMPLVEVQSNEDLEGYGYLVDHPDQFRCEDKTFEIVKWPVSGWRQLDPDTGDEAGTTEGKFSVWWMGDFYYAKNHAINTTNNEYLDGIGCMNPEEASHDAENFKSKTEEISHFGNCIYLWMSDYHPDGGQLFFPQFGDNYDNSDEGNSNCNNRNSDVQFPIFAALGKNTIGDDIRPDQMRAFKIPAGKGLYVHPGTWHNGIYINRKHAPQTVFTRQGKVHGRVSVSWAQEFDTLLRLPLAV